MAAQQSEIVKVEADIRVATKQGTFTFSIVGTGAGIEGLDQLGAYIGARVHDEATKLIGFARWQERIDWAQKDAAAARHEAAAAKQALQDYETVAAQQRLARAGAKRADGKGA